MVLSTPLTWRPGIIYLENMCVMGYVCLLLWVRYLSLQPLRELFVMHTTFWLSAYAVMKLFYFLLLVSWVERKLCYLLSSTNNDGDKDGWLAVPDLNRAPEALWPHNSQKRDPKCWYIYIYMLYLYICFMYIYMVYIVSMNVLYIIYMYVCVCVYIYIYIYKLYIYIVYMNAFPSTSLLFWNTSRMNHSPKSRFYSWINMAIHIFKCHQIIIWLENVKNQKCYP